MATANSLRKVVALSSLEVAAPADSLEQITAKCLGEALASGPEKSAIEVRRGKAAVNSQGQPAPPGGLEKGAALGSLRRTSAGNIGNTAAAHNPSTGAAAATRSQRQSAANSPEASAPQSSRRKASAQGSLEQVPVSEEAGCLVAQNPGTAAAADKILLEENRVSVLHLLRAIM